MAKLQIALCFLLSACIFQGIKSFAWDSLLDEWNEILELVQNTPITNQSCVDESWDIEQLSSTIQMNSSVSCLTELKAAVESGNLDDTALLEIIDELIAIFTEGATCTSTEDIWDYVECYITIIVNAIKYILSAWTTEASAAWELWQTNSTIKSLAESCVATIVETAVAANFKSAVQETVECVEKWTS